VNGFLKSKFAFKSVCIAQVEFGNVRVVSAVATQGRKPGSWPTPQYVTAYRVLYSTDCVDFVAYTEAGGADKVQRNTVKAAVLQNILKQSFVTNISKYIFKYVYI